MSPGAGSPGIRSPIGGILDSGSDTIVGHRLVVETRDYVQVGMEAALIVPAKGVPVWREPFVQLGTHEKQEFPCQIGRAHV